MACINAHLALAILLLVGTTTAAQAQQDERPEAFLGSGTYTFPPDAINNCTGASGTLVDAIDARDDMRFFAAALDETGLDALLSQEDGRYVVFGASDAAFNKLKDSADLGALNADLKDLIEGHIAAAEAPTVDAVAAGEPTQLTALTERAIDAAGDEIDGSAKVVARVEACNGLLVVIDEILLPETEAPPAPAPPQSAEEEGEEEAPSAPLPDAIPPPLGSSSLPASPEAAQEIAVQPALPEEPRADEPLCSSSDPSCCDLPPPEFTCAEQSNFGKCNENWMLVGAGQGSFCDLTCGRCGGGFAPAPTNDDAPSTAPLFADAPDFAVSPGASPSPPFSLSSPSSPSSFSPFPSPAPPQGQEERGGGEEGAGACECTRDGWSGGVNTGRVGCFEINVAEEYAGGVVDRYLGDSPFRGIWGAAARGWARSRFGGGMSLCYVQQPDRCAVARPSTIVPGAAWISC